MSDEHWASLCAGALSRPETVWAGVGTGEPALPPAGITISAQWIVAGRGES